jgi:hypothetical protein
MVMLAVLALLPETKPKRTRKQCKRLKNDKKRAEACFPKEFNRDFK